MKILRNQSDVWNSVDDEKPPDVGIRKWKRSYRGVYQALLSIGLIVQTTEEEFEQLEIPLRSNGTQQYMWRKIIVKRNDVFSEPTRIDNLITGINWVLGGDEKRANQIEHSRKKSLANPKGVLTTHNSEKNAIDRLDSLLQIEKHVKRSHLWEHRLADVAYSHDGVFWAADQVKTAKIDNSGRCSFNSERTLMKVGYMIKILEHGFSLTCIGKDKDEQLRVVWYFFGFDALDMLNQFDAKQYFCPVLIPKTRSYNRFTQAYSQSLFRFDLDTEGEIERLRLSKLHHVELNSKYTLKFLNEDDSQIPGPSHRIEQKSFEMTRDACRSIGVEVIKHHYDSYGSVDFRIEDCRIQDKVAGNYQCCMRGHEGRYPYDPDNIDVFQVSFLNSQIMYAIPMRVMKNDEIISHFSAEDLMKISINIGAEWKRLHYTYRYDLKDIEQTDKYIEACRDAARTPKLTDKNFYQNILIENRNKFGSVKNLRSRRIEKPVKIRRKISDVWKSVEHIKPVGQNEVKWKQSYLGISSALQQIGLKLEMSEKDFKNLEIPIKDGYYYYLRRKVIVSRDGVLSKPIKIECLLTGESRLLTRQERNIQYRAIN